MKTKAHITRESLPLPAGKELFRYQEKAVRKIKKNGLTRVLLADEMGLGKSPQSLVCRNIWQPQHTVIVAPAVMLGTWEREVEAWSTIPATIQIITKGNQKSDPTANVTIISYGLAAKHPWLRHTKSLLMGNSPANSHTYNSMLILDEAHYLKNIDAMRTRAVLHHLAPFADYLMLLTGTPITKSVMDLYPLVQMCAVPYAPDDRNQHQHQNGFPSYHGFAAEYAFRHVTPWGKGYEYRGLRNKEKLKEVLAPFMIRRKKRYVLRDLPKRSYANVYLSIRDTTSYSSLTAHREAAEQLQNTLNKNGELRSTENYATLRRELGLLKLPAILDWLSNYRLQEPNQPLVIFATHHAVIDSLFQTLTEYWSSPTAIITGETPLHIRQQHIDNFQAGKLKYLICNMQAGGIGVTLTKASTAIFVELDWSPSVIDQCIGRLHRIGQTNPVMVYFLLAERSLDEVVIKVLRRKLDLANQVLEKESKKK